MISDQQDNEQGITSSSNPTVRRSVPVYVWGSREKPNLQEYATIRNCCISYVRITMTTRQNWQLMTSDPDHKRVMEGIRTFYNKFTKAMEQILAQYNGKILKATLYWTGLACYFPKTSDYTDEDAIKDVLECCLKQIERQESLSIVLACENEKLPQITYNIGIDYEALSHDIVLGDSSPSAYRLCSTISTNTAILGDDLYKIIKALPRIQEKYLIEKIGERMVSVVNDVPYSVYSLSRRT